MRRITHQSLLVLLLMTLVGCAGTKGVVIPEAEVAAFLADKPKQYQDEYKQLLYDGKSNECLNYMKIGLKAMKNGDKEVAQTSFDHALLTIDSFFSNTEGAQKARSLWYEEGMKDFKGEPYERVMTFYYRGLLYMAAGDYDNARACFKSAIMQDEFAEEQQYRADFALVIFFEGLAAKLAGDREAAESSFAELKKLRPDFSYPDDFNTVFIVETGTSPRKVADGPGHAELKYFRGRGFSEKRASIKVDDAPLQTLFPMEDIFFQASTRGGRQIDKILKDKVEFRQTNLAIGSAVSGLGSTAMLVAPLTGSSMGTVQGIAGGLAIAGAVQQLIAINAKPHADTRYWDNLPDTVHLGFGQLSKGNHKIEVVASDGKGHPVKEAGKKATFSTASDKSKLSLVWLKVR